MNWLGAAIMADGRNTRFSSFTCPNCQALYQLIRDEVRSETDNREITCHDCGAPFPARDGKFVLKYFTLRQAARVQKWNRRRLRG
jgi:predicted RNA-binding Zn-ribbon protein involved in translation (DUF1610 family)